MYGIHPHDLERYRGHELRALANDLRDRMGLEREEVETMTRLKQWLESQGG